MGATYFFEFKPQYLLTTFVCFSLGFLHATDVSNETELNLVFNGTNPSPANIIAPFSLTANAAPVTTTSVELTSNGSSIDCNGFSLVDVFSNSTLRLDPSFVVSGSVPNWAVQNFGTFEITADQNIASSNQSSSPIEIDSTGTLIVNADNISNPITLTGQITIQRTLPGTATLSGSITQTGLVPSGFSKTGPGTIKLSNTSNNYSGITEVNEGTLEAGATNSFSPNSIISLSQTDPTATLSLNGFNITIAGLEGGARK